MLRIYEQREREKKRNKNKSVLPKLDALKKDEEEAEDEA